MRYPNSLGTFYEMVTASLGYNPDRHAGKIVGLAAYGDPERLAPALLETFERTPGAFRIKQAQNHFVSRMLASRYPMIDVAAAYQHVLEVVVQEWVAHWIRETGCDAVVLSGGVTANVKMNQRVFEVDGVKRVFVYPNMGDGGCGVGRGGARVDGRRASRRVRDRVPRPRVRRRGDPRGARCGGPEVRRARRLRGAGGEAHPRRPGRRALRRPHGVRPARARQPVDPLPRPRAGREPVAEQAARVAPSSCRSRR